MAQPNQAKVKAVFAKPLQQAAKPRLTKRPLQASEIQSRDVPRVSVQSSKPARQAVPKVARSAAVKKINPFAKDPMTGRLNYMALRAHMQDGDLLLYRGARLSSRIVSVLTGSKVSHVGVLAWWGKRLMVLETLGQGVVASPLTHNLEHFQGTIEYFKPDPNLKLTDEQRDLMLDFARLQLGKSYGIGQRIGLFFRVLFRRSLNASMNQKDQIASHWFCSQFVSSLYHKAGVDLAIPSLEQYMAPVHIVKSPLLRRVGLLK